MMAWSLFALFTATGFALEPYWWHKFTSMRTVSPMCNAKSGGMDFDGLLAMVDKLDKEGVKVFTLDSVYNPSSLDNKFQYDPSNLWCGLAMSMPQQPNPVIGSEANFRKLADELHSRGMALGAWYNPSYMWTGSKHFKQAEADMKAAGGDVNRTPADSPARWFSWGDLSWAGGVNKPRDEYPNESDIHGATNHEAWRWIADYDAGKSYFSTWSEQPITDWNSPEWQAYFKETMQYWISMGVDLFVFDAPTGYLNAGTWSWGKWPNPAKDSNGRYINMKEHLTDVVREVSGNRAVALAELYIAPEDSYAYAFDGFLGDVGGNCGASPGSPPNNGRAALVAEAVITEDGSGLDIAFAGQGGSESAQAFCYYNEWCQVAWHRQIVTASMLPGSEWKPGMQYNCFSGHGAGYSPDCEGSSNGGCTSHTLDECFDVCESDPQCDAITVNWNTGACFKRGQIDVSRCYGDIYPSDGYSTLSTLARKKTPLMVAINAAGGYLTAVEYTGANTFWDGSIGNQPLGWPGSGSLHDFYKALENDAAFGSLALWTPLPTSSKAHYALLRYNALDSLNNGSTTAAVGIAVFNLHSGQETVTVDLGQLPLDKVSGSPVDIVTGKAASALSGYYSVSVPGYGYTVLGHVSLPSWKRKGFINCYSGHGAGYSPDSSGDMTIAACFLTCLKDSRCDAVTMQYLPYGRVSCFKRGEVNYSACDGGGNTYNTFAVNKNAKFGSSAVA